MVRYDETDRALTVNFQITRFTKGKLFLKFFLTFRFVIRILIESN